MNREISNRWIWPFELEEKIGEGGMGLVYRARYIKNNSRVAVKLVPSDVADPKLLARFERELSVLRKLKHPHIVTCFGGVCEDQQRFYAMELVDGGSLDRLIREKGKLTWEQAVEYGLQMCAALECAHLNGIVHRDVKPGNFLITRSGKLKLSDFGLVSVVSARKLTDVGHTMGTVLYMAPEQIRGTPPPSPQTDLYSLGCVLFEMLTGHPPFFGDTVGETVNLHLKGEIPRVTREVPDCPSLLEELITDLLNKSPELRPSSAKAVAERLKNLTLTVTHLPAPASLNVESRAGRSGPNRSLPAQEPPAVVLRSPSDFRWIIAAGAGLLLALLFLGLYWSERVNRKRSEGLWITTFQEASIESRVVAADALGKLGPSSPVVVKSLAEGLSSKEPRVRQAAATALGRCGGSAKHLIPQLTNVQKLDEVPDVRFAAGEAVELLTNSRGPRPFLWLALSVAAALGVLGWSLYSVRKMLPQNPPES